MSTLAEKIESALSGQGCLNPAVDAGEIVAIIQEQIKKDRRAVSAPSPTTPVPLDLVAVLSAVDVEPELPGPMPPGMFEILVRDPDALAETMRIVVRQTKQGIRARIAAMSATPEVVPSPATPADDDAPPWPIDREDYHDALRYLIKDLAERNAAIDRIMAAPASPVPPAPGADGRAIFDAEFDAGYSNADDSYPGPDADQAWKDFLASQPIPPEAGHPADHAFAPDSTEGESMCGRCGWEEPNAEG